MRSRTRSSKSSMRVPSPWSFSRGQAAWRKAQLVRSPHHFVRLATHSDRGARASSVVGTSRKRMRFLTRVGIGSIAWDCRRGSRRRLARIAGQSPLGRNKSSPRTWCDSSALVGCSGRGELAGLLSVFGLFSFSIEDGL
jgi:hypothetical protein